MSIIKSLSSWYWPASVQLGESCERRLLKDVDVQFEDVPVKAGQVTSYIHCAFNVANNDGGNGRPPVVIAHGLGAGLAFFYKNIQPLIDEGWSVYAFDWLGMGRSGRPSFPTFPQNTVESIIDFFIVSLEEWRTKMNLKKKFILIGHSLGGYLAALYALRYPNRVELLILSSPVGLPIFNHDNSNNNNKDTRSRIQAVTGHEVPSWMVTLWNRNYTPQSVVRTLGPIGPRLTFGYVNARFQYLSDVEKKCLSEYLYQISADLGSGEYALSGILMPGAWAREPLHDRLRLLSMPCHFIYGESDWMDYKHAVLAAEHMTVRTSITRVSNAGHHLYLDNPEEYNQCILRLLNERC